MWLGVLVAFLLIFVVNKCWNKAGVYPPGYWGLPLIGYIPLNRKTFESNLLELRRRHGNSPIILWRMGTKVVIFLFEPRLIREAFTSKEFTQRPRLRILGFLGGSDLGLIAGNGAPWLASRRFTLHHLRDLGMGKSCLMPVIHHEAAELVKSLRDRAHSPTPLLDSIKVASLNVIWQMVASKRYSSEDENLQKFYQLLAQFRQQSDNAMLVDFMPWLPDVLPRFLFRRVLDEEVEKKFGNHLRSMLLDDIAEHKKALNIDDPKDYIDAYLAEMKKREGDPDSSFSEDDLIACTSDLFGTGTETVSLTLQWIIFYVAWYPEVQRRLQEEIDRVLPMGTLATLEDRQRLPFTEAVISEVLRHSNFLKFGGLHTTDRDTMLGGFRIPKGSILSRVTFWTNMDPEIWDSPKEFRPERFLDADGKFIQSALGFYPFGIGKRQCVGEPLARMELLVFLAALLQSLSFDGADRSRDITAPIPITLANLPDPNHKLVIRIR